MEPPLSIPVPRPWLWPSMWRDGLVVSDPPRERLLLGARVTLTVGGSALASLGLVHGASMPTPAAVAGVMVALMGSISLQDPDPEALWTTVWWAPVPAAGALLLGVVVPAHGLLSSAIFLAIIGAAVAARRWGKRGTALGMVSFFAYFAAQMSGATPAQAPWLLAALAVSLAVLMLVRFVLLPDRAERVQAWLLDAYRRSFAVLLALMAQAAAQGALTPRQERTLRRARRRVNETAILVEATLGADDARPFEAELAAEQACGALAEALQQNTLGEAARREVVAALLRVRTALRHGATPDFLGVPVWSEPVPALPEALAALERAPLWQLATRTAGASGELPAGLTGLLATTAAPVEAAPPAAVAPPADAALPADAAPAVGWVEGLDASTRQAIQAVVACGLAMVIGRWLSPERWTWAVITAFVVFSQATTRGESMRRAWQRVLGTVLGAGAGLALARLVHGHLVVEISAAFVVLFVGLYLMRVSYAWMVGGMSMLVAVVYDLLGELTPGLLVLRVDETLAGATLGALVAAVVLPSRTMAKVREAGAGLLTATREFLQAAASEGRAPGQLAHEVRKLDAQLVALRAAALPLTSGPVLVDPVATRLVESSEALVFLVRQSAGVAFLDPERRAAAAQLARRACLTARVLQGVVTPPEVSTAEALPTATPTAAMRWLGRIDEALAQLDEAARELRPSTVTPLTPAGPPDPGAPSHAR